MKDEELQAEVQGFYTLPAAFQYILKVTLADQISVSLLRKRSSTVICTQCSVTK